MVSLPLLPMDDGATAPVAGAAGAVRAPRPAARLDHAALADLLAVLAGDGHEVVAPTVRDGAIVYDTIDSVEALPRGVSDEQGRGHYRLTRPGHDAYFAHAVGPHAWKKVLFPSRRRLWSVTRQAGGGLDFTPDPLDATPRALIGVRPCELAAIAIQDRVFMGRAHADPDYRARRSAVTVVAVDCTAPAGTCFCASMGTGPRAADGFDLALTEVEGDGAHWFLARAGSERGDALLARIPHRDATVEEVAEAERRVEDAEARMGRTMQTDGLRELLLGAHESPYWDQVATRCVTCSNCTMTCPTCFCSGVEDVPLLDGERAERWRSWSSCFTREFSYIHGGAVRPSPMSKYRQWLTHKLGNWWEQFGSSGCVGCGRCITWCPVGIDITEEVATLRGIESARWQGRPRTEEGA